MVWETKKQITLKATNKSHAYDNNLGFLIKDKDQGENTIKLAEKLISQSLTIRDGHDSMLPVDTTLSMKDIVKYGLTLFACKVNLRASETCSYRAKKLGSLLRRGEPSRNKIYGYAAKGSFLMDKVLST